MKSLNNLFYCHYTDSGHVDNNEINQRARKSFPTTFPMACNRSNINTAPQQNLNNSSASMVYIPMNDGKQYQRNDNVPILNHIQTKQPIAPVTTKPSIISIPIPMTAPISSTPSVSTTNSQSTIINIASSSPPPLTSVSSGIISIHTLPVNTQLTQISTPPTSIIQNTTTGPPPLTLSSSVSLSSAYTMASITTVNAATPNATIHAMSSKTPPQTESSRHMLGESVTENLASAVTETIAQGPPRLISKPSGALRSDGTNILSSEIGPISRMLIDNSHKVNLSNYYSFKMLLINIFFF